MRREVSESKAGRSFGHGRQIHFEEVDGEFPVDVVKLELVLILLVFDPILWREPSKGIQVEGTLLADAFVDVEMLAILRLSERMTTVGTMKG